MKQASQLLIHPVLPHQAADLSALCYQIYPHYFTYLWLDAGAWYLQRSYNETKLRTELEQPDVRYFWAVINGERVGYLKINLHKELPTSREPGGLEIERIYFLPGATGKGLGTLLINYAESIARQYQKNYIWLHVMDSSLDSIAFYKKTGFRLVGETTLPFDRMRPEYRRMWQLRKTLPRSP